MSWVRTGSCSQCGQCCMVGTIAQFMLNLDKTQCKYLIKENGKYICEITTGKFENPEDSDMKELIPKEDFDYWKQECQPYPDPMNEDHQSSLHQLYPKCTYTISKEE